VEIATGCGLGRATIAPPAAAELTMPVAPGNVCCHPAGMTVVTKYVSGANPPNV
jgi:hypothetical protein